MVSPAAEGQAFGFMSQVALFAKDETIILQALELYAGLYLALRTLGSRLRALRAALRAYGCACQPLVTGSE